MTFVYSYCNYTVLYNVLDIQKGNWKVYNINFSHCTVYIVYYVKRMFVLHTSILYKKSFCYRMNTHSLTFMTLLIN